MTIFRKELRAGAVSLLIWSAVIGGFMAVCVGLYPSMEGGMGDMTVLFASMGQFSAAFGLDKLQFGMGLLAGEEGGHTAEFLLTHPISRRRVAGEKLAALAVMILALNLVCFACGAGSVLAIGKEAEWGDLLRYHASLLLMQLEVGGLCFGLSSLLRRSSFGLAMGLAAGLYFLGLLINLDKAMEPLRFVTPYFYADAARVFAGEPLAGPILSGCALGLLGAAFGLVRYVGKDIAA